MCSHCSVQYDDVQCFTQALHQTANSILFAIKISAIS